jgi:hypothetical protein
MKNKIFLLFSLLIIASCQEKSNQSSNNEPTEIKQNKNTSERILFDLQDISHVIKKKLSEEYWLGSISIQKIVEKNGGLILDLWNDDYAKKLIVTDKYFIVSYAVDASEENTLVYNKSTKEHFIINDFTKDLINSSTILVERDYYDSLDFDDPNYQGHIFEEGEFNLDSKKYKKLRNI